jgi:hypothetical protein
MVADVLHIHRQGKHSFSQNDNLWHNSQDSDLNCPVISSESATIYQACLNLHPFPYLFIPGKVGLDRREGIQ